MAFPSFRVCGMVALLWGVAAPTLPQMGEAVDPRRAAREEKRQQRLSAVEGWGLEQLLRAQQELDYKQKFRASTSSNPDELSLLAGDEDSGVRFYVATNRYTPREVLLDLAYDSAAFVRAGVAMSLFQDVGDSPAMRRLIEQIALLLAGDPQVLVRLALAQNEEVPSTVCDSMAHDPDPIVRQKLAANEHATPNALEALAQDSVLAVQTKALVHRNLPLTRLEAMGVDPQVEVRLAVCHNPLAPVDVLDALAADPDARVRQAVALHPNTALSTLEKMTTDGEPAVLIAVSNHPRADRNMLTRLARDGKDGTVRVAARQRLLPLLRSEIREDVLERWDSR